MDLGCPGPGRVRGRHRARARRTRHRPGRRADHDPGRAEPDAGAAAVAGARDAHGDVGPGARCDRLAEGCGWSLPTRVLGTGVGVALVATFTTGQLGVAVALMVLVVVVLTVRTIVVPINRTSLLVTGFVSGVTGTATSIGGPPMALLYQHRDPRQLRCTLAVYFLIGAALSLAGLAIGDALHGRKFEVAAILSPTLALGFHRLATAAPQGGPRTPALRRPRGLRAGLDRAAGPLARVTSVAWQGRPMTASIALRVFVEPQRGRRTTTSSGWPRRPRTWASMRSSGPTTCTRWAPTVFPAPPSRGRCSPDWPGRPRASGSARWSRRARSGHPVCWRSPSRRSTR